VRVQATRSETTNGYGLCMTCNNAPTCFFRASRGPALFCELFDDYVPPVSQTPRTFASMPQDTSLVASTTGEDATQYTGLCMNCDQRHTCRHPKPAGGVWHCENYT
jgi:hypothetical protein